MSNTSIRPIPTLRGMFTVPRATPGRNFLKENKKTLRSLEKATAEKLAAKEPVRPKWMPPLRRTASDSHEPCQKHCQAENFSVTRQNDDESAMLRNRNNSRSQHSLQNPVAEEPSGDYAPSVKREQQKGHSPSELSVKQSERCLSCGSGRSSTSIGIQTEDIMDETYLTNALKKCNFDTKTILSDGRNLGMNTAEDDYGGNYRGYGQYEEDDQPLSGRSNSKYNQLNIDDNDGIMPMPELHNLSIDNNDEEAPLSGRSRATIGSMASTATTKSKRREHKLGSRDDLRLPRYLEKEKRDKAEARERHEARDPDCPRGHVLLSETDRLNALAKAKQRKLSLISHAIGTSFNSIIFVGFELLIKELNHMPMTAQTLRVRSRKAEIDKELTLVEDDIRIYSKEKVYVKANKSRNL
ncbi:hypothetical protein KR093_008629 [Drosophila rubida]|uniref:Enkurin domain-containing protein n=1 Tax=Drosophila rubida TaxID=30044 RepID=A0AAD4K2D2_9MUSC|nr:hypothetical protein KR093_008629 [Drosophila rubida]